jgi:hypothetical protein
MSEDSVSIEINDDDDGGGGGWCLLIIIFMIVVLVMNRQDNKHELEMKKLNKNRWIMICPDEV